MLGFAVRHAFQRQLHDVVGSLAIRSLCTRTCGFTSDQPGIFDALVQAMLDHGIIPIDESGEVIVFPHEKALMAVFRFLKLKMESRIVAFILDAVQAASSA